VEAIATWPADGAGARRVVGVGALHVRDQVERDVGHRQHPAVGAEQPAQVVQRPDGVPAVHLGEPGQHQVADRVAGEHARPAEAVLQQRRHLPGALGVRREGGQRHPQVPRR
jgi:hypothetical protein